MHAGTRFVHTADWQLGMRAGHIPGDSGAGVRRARFEVIERIASVARDADADFVVVAGDVFEHHALHRENTQRTFHALRAFQCPVFLLPGNHDPYTPDALYRTEWWRQECPAGVKVLGRPEPVALDGVTLLPCPLTERHMSDPTAWLQREPARGDTVRVAVAHGGVREFLAGRVQPEEMVNDISVNLTERAGLDYLALGDWHGLGQVNERAWYSGTPEATGFSEENPGHVLLVSVDQPRALPKVEPVSVARYQWRTLTRLLAAPEDVQALENELAAFPAPSTTLLEVVLQGVLDLTRYEHAATTLPARFEGVFHHLRWNTRDLHVRLSDNDFDALPREGWAGKMVQRLREGRVPGADAEACQRALQQLHRIQLAARFAGSAR